ncbi:MAG: cation:proton antiporter, partial [Bulleidia sp.]
ADDVYVIVLFSAFLSMVSGGSVSFSSFLQIPSAIVLGILAGILSGLILNAVFQKVHPDGSLRVILVLSVSFLLEAMEDLLKGTVSVSGLLAIISLCMVLRRKDAESAEEMGRGLGKLWNGAQIFLFVLVGAEVKISSLLSAGAGMAVLLILGLLFRSAGTLLSVSNTELTGKEKSFVMIAEIPKATVQAAIGGIPLSMGLACGDQVLTLSVLAILITAPLGSVLISSTYRKLCTHDCPVPAAAASELS